MIPKPKHLVIPALAIAAAVGFSMLRQSPPEIAESSLRETSPTDFPDRSATLPLDQEGLHVISTGGWAISSGSPVLSYSALPKADNPVIAEYYLETDTVPSGAYRTRSSHFTKVSDNKYKIAELYGSAMTGLEATISGSTLTIPAGEYCSVTNSTGATAMATLCPIDLNTNNIYPNKPVTGVILQDGTIELPAWGIFVIEESQVSAVAIVKASKMRPANATVSGKVYGSESSLTWGVILSQDYTNRLTVENFGNTGENADIDLLTDRTAEIAPQYMGTVVNVGELDCMALSATGAGLSTEAMKATASGNGLELPAWGICAILDPSKSAIKMDKSLLSPMAGVSISWPQAISASFQGSGSESSPYLISTYTDLLALSQQVASGKDQQGVYYQLTKDIDCSAVDTYFTPIGTVSVNKDFASSNNMPEGNCFEGTLDGNGHAITGLNYQTGRRGYTGLIGWLGQNGTVKNLTVKNSTFLTYGIGLGAIAGISYGTISNCSVSSTALMLGSYHGGGIAGVSKGIISGSDAYTTIISYGNTGGICGTATGTITGCKASGSITFRGPDNTLFAYCGGIAGMLNGSYSLQGVAPAIEKSYTTTLITDLTSSGCTGGIAGVAMSGASAQTPVISETLAINTIASNASDATSGSSGRLGGILGTIYNARVKDCYVTGVVMAPAAPKNLGGVVGYIMSGPNNSIANVVSSCQPISNASTPDPKTAICGGITQESAAILKNVYYDSQITGLEFNEFGFASAVGTSALISGVAPEGIDASLWTFTKGLYPRISSLVAEPVSSLAAAPVILPEGESSRAVKADFELSTANSVAWGVLTDNGLKAEGAGLSIKDGKAIVKNEYARDILCGYIEGTPYLKEVIVNIVPSSTWAGAGTEENPYQIRTLDDLKNLEEGTTTYATTYEGVYFKLMNDIDCAGDTSFGGIASDGVTAHEFAGIFDGGGYTIDNLVMDKVGYKADGITGQASGSKTYAGFIGRLNKSGVIRNLTLGKGCRMKFWTNSGAISGFVAGTIENCVSYATVEGLSSYIGGVAGQVQKTTGLVKGCLFAGKVTGGLNGTGGIAGYSYGNVEYCQNDGIVLGDSVNPFNSSGKANYIGGIVGYSSGSVVKSCVNQGSVTGPKSVGGIVGYALGATAVSNSLNTGILSTESRTASRGAIVGTTSGTTFTMTDNYYDAQIMPYGAINLNAAQGCSGMATASLCAATLPSGLSAEDFDAAAGMYPVLKIFADAPSSKALRSIVVNLADGETVDDVANTAILSSAEGLNWSLEVSDPAYKLSGNSLLVTVPQGNVMAQDVLTGALDGFSRSFAIRTVPNVFPGSGTAADPFLIQSKEDMALLASKVNEENITYGGKYFRLTKDLDYSSDKTFRPIGYNAAVFGGHFNGDGHTISNLTVDYLDEAHTALFGNVGDGASVSNLTLKGGRFAPAAGKTKGVAAFVYSLGGSVSNCVNYNEMDASTGTYAAGIVYEAKAGAVISRCFNYGKVSAKSGSSGGIVGDMKAGSLVDSCENHGEVAMLSTYIGGIAGKSAGTISHSLNDVALEGEKNGLGGIVGYSLDTCRIASCVNTGKIDLKGTAYYVGGIVGYGYGRTYITDSENKGDVSVIGSASNGKAGGLAGQLASGSSILNSSNYGNITAVTGPFVGGLVGYCDGNSSKGTGIHKDSHNFGAVTGIKQVGGLFGRQNAYNEVSGCTNSGSVTSAGSGAQDTGGIAGYGYSVYTACRNYGDISTTGYYAGGIIGDGMGSALEDCVNTGAVTSTSTETAATKPLAAGIWGYGRGTVNRCVNFGPVTAPTNASGLIGYFTTKVEITSSYVAAKVSATADDGVSAPVLLNTPTGENKFEGLFYDMNLYKGATPDSGIAKGLSTQTLYDYDLGEGWEMVAACYPVLSALKEDSIVNFHSAGVALGGTDTSFENVTCPLILGQLPGVKWAVSDGFAIESNQVIPLADTVKGTAGTITKTGIADLSGKYDFVLGIFTGLNSIWSDSTADKEYYSLEGFRLLSPEQGRIVIEVSRNPDGTIERRKIVF